MREALEGPSAFGFHPMHAEGPVRGLLDPEGVAREVSPASSLSGGVGSEEKWKWRNNQALGNREMQ